MHKVSAVCVAKVSSKHVQDFLNVVEYLLGRIDRHVNSKASLLVGVGPCGLLIGAIVRVITVDGDNIGFAGLWVIVGDD